MAVGRVYRSRLSDPVSSPKGRVYRARVTGSAAATPKGRVYRARTSGSQALAVDPIAAQTIEPLSTVTLTATINGGGAADSYTWRQISGTPVTLMGTGATRTFTSPAGFAGQTLTFGVRATLNSANSAELTVTVEVRQQLVWTRVPGADWVGARVVI